MNARLGIRHHDLSTGILSRELRLRVLVKKPPKPSSREFQTTRARHAPPLLAVLIGALKSSTALGILGTAFRISLTFIPAILVKNTFLIKYIRKIPKHFPEWQHKIPKLTRLLSRNRRTIRILLVVPMLFLGATMLASLERAPLTGRWRVILISPKEEEEIIKSLSGTWRSAVNSVLAATLGSETPPPALPPSDWRYQWVLCTLRRLENAVPALQLEDMSSKEAIALRGGRDYPFPPPCPYPLQPRPRPAQMLHSIAEYATFEDEPTPPHMANLIGPPYSCLVVEKPDSQNAFSYGFGPNGAGGVVVYTGFLDEVLRNLDKPRSDSPAPNQKTMPSFWSSIFGALIPPQQTSSTYVPTEQQTAELAVLLAHELSHLLLSHHLETLSSGTILYPSVVSIFADVLRTLLFPITMLLGPFVNDALGKFGRDQSGQIGKLGEMCNGRKLEIEADIVSARLLAYAGFDPREAVKFWEHRVEDIKRAECAVQGKTRSEVDQFDRTVSWAMGKEHTHPLNEERVKRLKDELKRWEDAWKRISLEESN